MKLEIVVALLLIIGAAAYVLYQSGQPFLAVNPNASTTAPIASIPSSTVPGAPSVAPASPKPVTPRAKKPAPASPARPPAQSSYTPYTPPASTYVPPVQVPPPVQLPYLTALPSDAPAGFAANQISWLWRKVRVSYSVLSYSAGTYGQVSLTAASSTASSTAGIDVTGWTIKGNHASQFVPQAALDYPPSGLASDGDVFLGNGDVFYLFTTVSTIGHNVRINRCIGYAGQVNPPVPAFPATCPTISQIQISGLSGACQNYILSLPVCALPTSTPPVPTNDYGCFGFMSNLNYNGCYSAYRNQSGFFSNQWWGWVGNTFLDPLHDKVDLYDRNGLFVDEYVY